MIIPLRSTGKSCPIGLTTAERKREESNFKRACTKLLKDYGGYSLPIPGGIGAVISLKVHEIEGIFQLTLLYLRI